MNSSYANELYELRKWVDDTSVSLKILMPIVFQQQVLQWIEVVALGVRDEYPYYYDILSQMLDSLFVKNSFGTSLNRVAFGELSFIVNLIQKEPVSMDFWKEVHPRIKEHSYALYRDGHFVPAAKEAVGTVATCLRDEYKVLNPKAEVPSSIGDVIDSIFGEDGVFQFCDASTESGRSYRSGVLALTEGLMTAYRNSSTPENVQLERHEAIEQIMIASRLMYVLDMKL